MTGANTQPNEDDEYSDPDDYSQNNLIGKDFSNQNLSITNFTKARLNNANFSEAILTDTTFDRADCRRADFQGVDLENSSFRNADLRNADFRPKNLQGTVFDGCLVNDGTELGLIGRSIVDTDSPDELAEIAATHRKLHSLLLRSGRLRDARKFGHDHLAYQAAAKHSRQTDDSFKVWKYRLYYYLYKYGSKPRTIAIPTLLFSAILIAGFGLLFPFIGIIRESTDAGPVDHTFVNSGVVMADFYHTLSFSLQKFAQGALDIFRILLLPFLSFSESEVVEIPKYTPIGDAEILAVIEYLFGVLIAIILLLSMIRIISLSIRVSTESDKTTLLSWLFGR